MNADKTGRFVWHDLFTRDARVSRSFYEGVAGWHFVTEHAKEFAWGGGENDFILAILGDEAGAGFVEHPHERYVGWVPYVEVEDVDTAAELARNLRGTVERAPFEVPGVGRNCLLRDPMGALIGICLSRHTFPVPTKQFAAERYVSGPEEFPADFYRGLFNWDILSLDSQGVENHRITHSGNEIALHATVETHSASRASWVPGIRVKQLSEALRKVQSLEGAIMSPVRDASNEDSCALVRDPNDTISFLIACR